VSLIRDNRISYSDVFDLPRLDGADGDVEELASELDRIEQRNSRAFAIYVPSISQPTAVNLGQSTSNSEVCARSSREVEFSGSDLFRVTPINRDWGWERGVPLDRPFIERFISIHRGDIYGRVLEVKEPEYTSRYAQSASQVDILDIDNSNKAATIVADLQSCAQVSDNTYDCIILTQVLQLVPDFKSAIANAARILRPGGTLLLTVCGITQGITSKEGAFCWSFFEPGLKHALLPYFDPKKLLLRSHGNVGLAASFLMGLTVADVPPYLLSFGDREYPIVVTARATKPIDLSVALVWPPAVMSPEVTIIIPMFNAESTIRETLYSICRQHYASYEILVINDGSTDKSSQIVEEIAAGSKGRIRVLEHPGGSNQGLSLSRNLGITHARGEFLVFLDADDTIHPGKLSHDVNVLRSYPEAIAVVGRALWWWDGEGNRDASLDEIPGPCDRIVYPPEFFEANYGTMSSGSPPCVHSWMVRKSAIDQVEPFDPYMMTYEDQKFLADLSLRFPIYVASTCMCDYRRKGTTLWATALETGSDIVARERFVEWKTKAMKRSPAYWHGSDATGAS
jgi:SAM-dependent methyltransferase